MSYVEELSAKYGWPLKIHSRGYDAYLVDVQPLLQGEVAPIYRWPGGDSVADDAGVKRRPADEFHRLMSMVWANPRTLDDKCDLFRRQPVDWYKEIALHAMKSISHELGPDQFSHCRHDTAGYAAHHVTKAVFEEQDIFDPYSDREFLEEAEKLLPWYIKRYTEGEGMERQTITHHGHTFELVDHVPCGYLVWNIGENMIDGYLPLCILASDQPFPGGRAINVNALKAIKCDGAQTILAAIGYGPETPDQMERYIEKYSSEGPGGRHAVSVERMRKALPLMREIKWD